MALSKRMLTHTANQERLNKVGNIQTTMLYAEGIKGSLQPLSNRTALEYGLMPSKAYAFYTNNSGFDKGDILVVDGKRYVVRDQTPYAGFGAASHNVVLLELAA